MARQVVLDEALGTHQFEGLLLLLLHRLKLALAEGVLINCAV